MYSAFGVDHGYEEIEKFGFGTLGTGAAKVTRGLAGSLSRGGAGLRRSAQAGTGARMAQPGKINKPMQALGTGMGKAGGALRKLSSGMAARPGLTGGVTAGAGALGVGGAGYAAGSMGGNNKKLQQYR